MSPAIWIPVSSLLIIAALVCFLVWRRNKAIKTQRAAQQAIERTPPPVVHDWVFEESAESFAPLVQGRRAYGVIEDASRTFTAYCLKTLRRKVLVVTSWREECLPRLDAASRIEKQGSRRPPMMNEANFRIDLQVNYSEFWFETDAMDKYRARQQESEIQTRLVREAEDAEALRRQQELDHAKQAWSEVDNASWTPGSAVPMEEGEKS